jgi:peptidoglycan/LPS O-acetylase OafA/YrhL
MTVPSNTASGRSHALDAVRAVACLMVVICHTSLYQGDKSWDGLKNGVMLFFALSGYLLYRPFVMGDVDLRRYAAHRVARIAPAYLVALVGVTILTGKQTFLEQPLTYLLFLQNYDLKLWQGFLGVSWTLVLEVLFYLTLPLLAFLLNRSPTRLAALSAWSFLAAFLIFLFVPSADPRITSSTFPTIVWVFAPGMFVALFEGRMRWAARPVTLALGIALLVLGTKVWWASIDLPSAVGSFLVVAWAVERRPALGRLAIPASIGAALTYSAYLWHVDLLKTIHSTPMALLAIVAVASLSYVLVERPFIRVGRYLARRKPTSAPGGGVVGGPVGTSVGHAENG